MNQTKLESFVEQAVNMFFKFWVAVCMWKFVIAPAIDAGYLNHQEALPITIIFTVLSLVQGYFWRRIFNRIHLQQLVHETITKFKKETA